MNESTLEIDRSMKTENEVMEKVIQEVLSGELSHIDSIRKVSTSPWGEPTTFYTGGKFMHIFAMVDVDEFLKLHNSIGHSTSGAYQETVDWVVTCIENNNEENIPTIPLVLEPEDFGENPMTYKVVREGRSRAVGAKSAGLEEIPVILAARRPRR